jgi:transcriptional repressor NrdR
METKVLDSRVIDEGTAIRRRRACEYCQHRYTTIERLIVTDLVVVKKDGSKELYERSKLRKAFILAFAKRDFSAEKIDELINSLEAAWSWKGKEITSRQIGEDVMALLKKEDPVAFIRFASVYKEFDTVDDFASHISGLA